ncbi:hypothetical protein KR067_005380 [Drosophila pandora]|nr:hypothetical protein KR067_005380 [Drosophila pandora]
MLRTITILLLIAVTINAKAVNVPQRAKANFPNPVSFLEPDFEEASPTPLDEESTFRSLPTATVTLGVDSDEIVMTSPEGEAFTEGFPAGTTEEPLPESVINQLEMERALEAKKKATPEESEMEAETEATEPPTTTETPNPPTTTETPKVTEKRFKFGATTLPPFFTTTTTLATTIKPLETTTFTSNTEETTQIPNQDQTIRNYFERREGVAEGDLLMAENRMATTTEAVEDTTILPNNLSLFMTTLANLVDDSTSPKEEQNEPVVETTLMPLFRLAFNADATTVQPEIKEEKATTVPSEQEATELQASTQPQETTTEPADTTSLAAITEPAPLTAKEEPQLSAHPEATTNGPESTTTTAATTTTTAATTTTTSTTVAPQTIATTTTPRPILTRAPRVERIFNSDGVEVLYGYSSVVRTNRS